MESGYCRGHDDLSDTAPLRKFKHIAALGFPKNTRSVRAQPQRTADRTEPCIRRKNRFVLCFELIHSLPKPIYGYGASTKGGTLLQYLDVPELLTAVADRNPLKWGLMQAGVWAEITSEETMRAAKPGTLFVLPWAFREEFVEREEALRADGTLMLFPLPNIEIVS